MLHGKLDLKKKKFTLRRTKEIMEKLFPKKKKD